MELSVGEPNRGRERARGGVDAKNKERGLG